MARVFQTLPGGVIKRVSNRLHGCESGRGGKNFYDERIDRLRAIALRREMEQCRRMTHTWRGQ